MRTESLLVGEEDSQAALCEILHMSMTCLGSDSVALTPSEIKALPVSCPRASREVMARLYFDSPKLKVKFPLSDCNVSVKRHSLSGSGVYLRH